MALVRGGKHVTLAEVDDPTGYFRMARTARVHLVKSVIRVPLRRPCSTPYKAPAAGAPV